MRGWNLYRGGEEEEPEEEGGDTVWTLPWTSCIGPVPAQDTGLDCDWLRLEAVLSDSLLSCLSRMFLFTDTAAPKLGILSVLVCCFGLSDNIASSQRFLTALFGVAGQEGAALMAVLSSVEQSVVVLDRE